jgi:NADH:ubiquinone oxidoreductase subunit K
VNIGWYLAVSVVIFCIGAAGVLIRRNPLVILLCLELMLNAANLALISFARMWGKGHEDGQIFALIVMVVAACEVTVGLGIIVAMYRRRLPIDVDELRELQG